MRPEEIEVGRDYIVVGNSESVTRDPKLIPIFGSVVTAESLPSDTMHLGLGAVYRCCNCDKDNTWVKIINYIKPEYVLACCCSLYPINDPDQEQETDEDEKVSAENADVVES